MSQIQYGFLINIIDLGANQGGQFVLDSTFGAALKYSKT